MLVIEPLARFSLLSLQKSGKSLGMKLSNNHQYVRGKNSNSVVCKSRKRPYAHNVSIVLNQKDRPKTVPYSLPGNISLSILEDHATMAYI